MLRIVERVVSSGTVTFQGQKFNKIPIGSEGKKLIGPNIGKQDIKPDLKYVGDCKSTGNNHVGDDEDLIFTRE